MYQEVVFRLPVLDYGRTHLPHKPATRPAIILRVSKPAFAGVIPSIGGVIGSIAFRCSDRSSEALPNY